MKDMSIDTAEAGSLQAILEGGPASIPTALRRQEVSPLEEKIKLPYLGGYEHFERVDDPSQDASGPQIIFRWARRTKIAE